MLLVYTEFSTDVREFVLEFGVIVNDDECHYLQNRICHNIILLTALIYVTMMSYVARQPLTSSFVYDLFSEVSRISN